MWILASYTLLINALSIAAVDIANQNGAIQVRNIWQDGQPFWVGGTGYTDPLSTGTFTEQGASPNYDLTYVCPTNTVTGKSACYYEFELDLTTADVLKLDNTKTTGIDSAIQCPSRFGTITFKDFDGTTLPRSANNKIVARYTPLTTAELVSLSGGGPTDGKYTDIFTFQYEAGGSGGSTNTKPVQIYLYAINNPPMTIVEEDECISYPGNNDLTGALEVFKVLKGGTTPGAGKSLNFIPESGRDQDEDRLFITDLFGPYDATNAEFDANTVYDMKGTITLLGDTSSLKYTGASITFVAGYDGYAEVRYRITDCDTATGTDPPVGRWGTMDAQKRKAQGCSSAPWQRDANGALVLDALNQPIKRYCTYRFTVGTPDGYPVLRGVGSDSPIQAIEDTPKAAALSRSSGTIPGVIKYYHVTETANPDPTVWNLGTNGQLTLPKYGTVTFDCGGIEGACGADYPYAKLIYTPFPNRIGQDQFYFSYFVADDAASAVSNPDYTRGPRSPANVFITISPVNDDPTVINFGTQFVSNARLNDTLVDADSHELIVPATPYEGSVSAIYLYLDDVDVTEGGQKADYIYIYQLTDYWNDTSKFSGRLWTTQSVDAKTGSESGFMKSDSEILKQDVLNGNGTAGFQVVVTNTSGITQTKKLYYEPGANSRSLPEYVLDVVWYVVTDQQLPVPAGKTAREVLEQYVLDNPTSLGRVGLSTRCRPGYYIKVDGDVTSCEPCAAGYFSTQYDVAQCTACPVKTFQNNTGQTWCNPCPKHTYMNHTGAPTCDKCPYPMITDNDGSKEHITDCYCPGRRTLHELDDIYPYLASSAANSPGFYGIAGMFCIQCQFANNLFSALEAGKLAECEYNNMTLPITGQGYYLSVYETPETDTYNITGVPRNDDLKVQKYSNITGRLTSFYLRGPEKQKDASGVYYLPIGEGPGDQRYTLPSGNSALLVTRTPIGEVFTGTPANPEGRLIYGNIWSPYRALVSECFPIEACPSFRSADFPDAFNQGNFTNQIRNMTWKPCLSTYDSARCALCRRGPDPTYCPFCTGAYRLDDSCLKCPSNAKTTFIVVIGIFLVVFAPFLFRFADALRNAPSIMVTLNFAQVLALFPSFHVPWPPELRTFWNKLKFFNFNIQIIHPDCISTGYNWANKFRGTAAAPLIVLGLVIAGILVQTLRMLWSQTVGRWLLRKIPVRGCRHHTLDCNPYRPCPKCRLTNEKPSFGLIGPPPKDIGFVRFLLSTIRMKLGRLITSKVDGEDLIRTCRSAVSAYFTFLKIGYLFLSGAAIEYWNCAQDRISGRFYLASDQSIECFNLGKSGGVWKELFGLGVFTLVTYPVGILVIFATLLTIAKDHLHEPTVLQMLGPLYENYTSKYYFWELCISARKFLILALQVFFRQPDARNGLRQTVASQAVLLFSLLAHVYFYPFRKRLINILESINIASAFFAVFVGMAFLSDETGKLSPGFKGFLTGIALVATGLGAVASLLIVLFELFPKILNFLAKSKTSKMVKERVKRQKQAQREAKKRGETFRDVEHMNRISLPVAMKVREFVRRAMIGFNMSRLLTPAAVRATFNMLKEGAVEMPARERLLQAFDNINKWLSKGETLSLRTVDKTPLHKLFKEEVQTPLLDTMLMVPLEDAKRVKDFLQKEVVALNKTHFSTLRQRAEKQRKKNLKGAAKAAAAAEANPPAEGDAAVPIGGPGGEWQPGPSGEIGAEGSAQEGYGSGEGPTGYEPYGGESAADPDGQQESAKDR